MGVEAGANCCAALGEEVEVWEGGFDASNAFLELGYVAENSWPRVSGVASWRWVRPILMMLSNCWDFFWKVVCKDLRDGSKDSVISRTAAICITVGKVSFEEADMLTWSLGWTGVLEPMWPPRISMARLEMTSLAFMFD